jgi:zinc/manganese transport system substrate-binding protein
MNPITPRRRVPVHIGFLSLVAILLAGPGTLQAALNLVASTSDLAALAREIGGDRVAVSVLAKPTEDPHFLDAKPSFISKLNRADALVEGGAELESAWLQPLIAGARNPRLGEGSPGRIACAAGLDLLEVPTSLDRSRGDVHAAGNPHFMTDPENARIVARHLCESLGALDPGSSGHYKANLNRFNERLDTKMTEWKAVLKPFQGRRVVAYHNTWPYFARRFGLHIDLFLEPKPGIPPSPAHLAAIIGRMKSESVRVILLEPFQDRRTAQSIAAKTDAAIVEVTQYPGGLKGTEGGYFELLDAIVKPLAAALSGSLLPTQP